MSQKGFLLVYLFISLSAFSQQYAGTMDTSVPEKIYLQFSSVVYTTDQTIWFKAIVVNAENHQPSELSGVLYVDLIDANGQILEHKLVKLEHGIGDGFFELQDGYVQGRYLIRAYTQWNLNFGDDFMFKSYVNVYDSLTEKNKNRFESLAVVEKEDGNFALTGHLLPQRMDGGTERQIQIYIDWGKGKDTITVKRKGRDSYPLEYEIPEEPNWINLTLDSDTKLPHTETIVLNDSLPDMQFFPESGRLVHGFRNKIGFKAVGFDGKGRKIRGEVFDARGNRVTDFESNHLGMGVFSVEADSSMAYHVKISLQTERNSTFTYPLPKVVAKGSILSIDKAKDKIRIRVATNDLKDRVYLKVSCRGTDYYLVEGPLREGYLVSELPTAGLPDGIIVFTLMDSNKKPVAERLYFNEFKKDRLDIALEKDKTLYGRREETKVEIKVSGNISTLPSTDISVMVINKEHMPQGTNGNIRSYLLLDSELQGKVEEPGYYFREENPSRFNDLDALLLTQGWRNYKYPAKRQGRIFFWPQPGLTVKGIVRPTARNKKSAERVAMTMATFGKETSFYTQQADSMGRFNFFLNDISGRRMRILLSANNADGKKTNYSLSLDSIRTPKVVYEPKPSVQKLNPVERAVVAAKERRDETKAVFDSLYGVTQLEEAVVEGYRLTPERKKTYKEFGEPDVVIRGEAIRAKEKKWSYGLYSILMFNYRDQVTIEQFSDGFMLAHINGGRGEPTLLMVDGKLLTKGQYEFVPNMAPGIVEDIELIKYARFFKKQYLKVFPEADPLTAPSLGHIISIYTKSGVGIYSTGRPPPGTLDTSIDVFSPVKEFYAPKYDKPIPTESQKPDLRSLIHWTPSIKADQMGNASVSFYNGDITGEYIIIVEAISSDGRIGYQEKNYLLREQDP